ncbi:hypothetical protein [Hyphomicrobium sp.]|uniref:hypothetical protein n=1 Tax=Hyphomicrobium sp. TaxID=82 RepID=UPI00345B777C
MAQDILSLLAKIVELVAIERIDVPPVRADAVDEVGVLASSLVIELGEAVAPRGVAAASEGEKIRGREFAVPIERQEDAADVEIR